MPRHPNIRVRVEACVAKKMSEADHQRARLEVHAEHILEKTLRRKRWLASDRDALVLALLAVVRAEEAAVPGSMIPERISEACHA